MNCKRIQILLPDVIQGTCSVVERAIVEDHLVACQSCREEEADLKRVIAGLEEIPFSTPGNVYWSSLLPAVHARIGKEPAPATSGWAVRSALPATAALLFVVFLMSVQLFNGSSPDQQVSSIIQQLSPDEIQQVADQAALSVESSAPAFMSDESAISSSDVDVLKQLLQSEDHTALYADLDVEDTLSSLSDGEESQLLSVLQEN